MTDALAALSARPVDAWVATSSGDGPYLVPLTLAWTGTRILLAVDKNSRTARNLATVGRARIGIGPTRDVVIVDVELDSASVQSGAHELAEQYAAQADWDPRQSGDDYRILALRPVRIQVWREANEIAGRTVMRDGIWLA